MSTVKYRRLQAMDYVDFAGATVNDLGNIGAATFTAPFARSIATGITAGAATQTQAASTALTAEINRVTTAAATSSGVSLPAAVAGRRVLIMNSAATNSVKVWPASGDKIDDGTANAVAATAIAPTTSREYIAIDATNWYTVR